MPETTQLIGNDQSFISEIEKENTSSLPACICLPKTHIPGIERERALGPMHSRKIWQHSAGAKHCDAVEYGQGEVFGYRAHRGSFTCGRGVSRSRSRDQTTIAADVRYARFEAKWSFGTAGISPPDIALAAN